MDFLKEGVFPVAEFYLCFFGASLLVLGLIALSGMPGWIRKCARAIRQIRARRRRSARMIADLEDLERAGARLEGQMLFERDEVFS